MDFMMSVIAGVVASVIGAMVSAYLTQRAKREEEGSAKLIVKSAELESNRERTRVEVMNVGSADAEEVKVEIVRYIELIFDLVNRLTKKYEDYKKEQHAVDYVDNLSKALDICYTSFFSYV